MARALAPRPLLEVVRQYMALDENPVHADLGCEPTYLTGSCPFCLTGRFVVLIHEDPQRWICRSCLYGGGREKFLEMILARTRTRRLSWDEFTLENAGVP